MREVINIIIEIGDKILPLLCVIIFGFLGLKTIGYKIAYQILLAATRWIQELETDITLTGPDKMRLVVEYIKNLIPRFFQVVFNDSVIEAMAESVFEDMQKYSENRVENKTGLSWNQMLQIVREAGIPDPYEITEEEINELIEKNKER